MEIIQLLLFTLFSGICLMALFLLLQMLFSRSSQKTGNTFKEMMGRSFLIGLVNTLFLLALALGAIVLAEATLDFIYLFALLIFAVFCIILALGLTAIVQHIGSLIRPSGNSRQQNLAGSLVAILACLTPFIGWFGLFPFLALSAVGAEIITLNQLRQSARKSKKSTIPSDNIEKSE